MSHAAAIPARQTDLAQRVSVTLDVAPAIRPGDPIPIIACCLEAVTTDVALQQEVGCTGAITVSIDGGVIASQTVEIPTTECLTLEAPTDGVSLGDHLVEVAVDGTTVASAEIRIVDLPNVSLPDDAQGPLGNIPPAAAAGVGLSILYLLFL